MLSPLYEKNKIWTIECFPNKDGSYSIKTTHGQINGKMIEHIVSVKEGKNIGAIYKKVITKLMPMITEKLVTDLFTIINKNKSPDSLERFRATRTIKHIIKRLVVTNVKKHFF